MALEALDRNLPDKLAHFRGALEGFIDRLRQDRSVLAAVCIGSLAESTIWWRDGISLWVIEVDGATRRLQADGNDERIWRTFVENGVNIHAELIPRSRFKRMVEGSSRTAFTHSFFAERKLVYCDDPSIEGWFDEANRLATKDQEKDLLVATTWVIHAQRHAERLLTSKKDLTLTSQSLVWAAHGLAAVEIVRRGEVYEEEIIYKAMEVEPELFEVVYEKVVARKPVKKNLRAAIDRIEAYLQERGEAQLRPLLRFLRKEKRVVPLSELSDHFAHTQLYPWHLESACEWLERRGRIEKVSAPFKITKKSRVDVEEPAYFLDT